MKITHNKVGQNLNVNDTGRTEKTLYDKSKSSRIKDDQLSALDSAGSSDLSDQSECF